MASHTAAVRRTVVQLLRQQGFRSSGAGALSQVQQQQQLLQPAVFPALQHYRSLQYHRGQSTLTASSLPQTENDAPAILSALPGQHLTAKVMFEGNKTADFKYIWLRDNCRCEICRDVGTKQKLLDTPALDVNIRPKSVAISEAGNLKIVWDEPDQHESFFEPKWLFKYGKSFMHNTFELDNADHEAQPVRSVVKLWDRTHIWKNMPEISYKEFMETNAGLLQWLDMFHKYGIAILRGVPLEHEQIVEVVKRYAYVKETQYGNIFDVVNQPAAGTHLAYSGVALAYHTDMNYREKSPGMQLLHCLKAEVTSKSGSEQGGRSMFVDGFRAARWMEENEPTAFHVLASTPVRFSIKNSGMRYSSIWPVICTNGEGDITEIHYNNRTMQPLQAPTHVVTPFYHAYKLFSQKLVEASASLEFNMVPGDLVAFNNRRTLHARSSYDVATVDRHLQGCYVDIDEAFSKYDQLLMEKHPVTG
uniref:Gamma-butyrobetaine dioxygenase-like n=1 Tax=Hirondellea gigas TaxID=1518452 RepID=A0A6A7FM21_9CRUS